MNKRVRLPSVGALTAAVIIAAGLWLFPVTEKEARADSEVEFDIAVTVVPKKVSEGDTLSVHVTVWVEVPNHKRKPLPGQKVSITVTWPDGSTTTKSSKSCKFVEFKVPGGVGAGDGTVDAEVTRGAAKGETGDDEFGVVEAED